MPGGLYDSVVTRLGNECPEPGGKQHVPWEPDELLLEPVVQLLLDYAESSVIAPMASRPDAPILEAGPVAQSVEQGTFNPKVAGSIPARPIEESPARAPTAAAQGGRWGPWGHAGGHTSGKGALRTGDLRSIRGGWGTRTGLCPNACACFCPRVLGLHRPLFAVVVVRSPRPPGRP
jgi:hypothetical protein